jgi:hypothetical protein
LRRGKSTGKSVDTSNFNRWEISLIFCNFNKLL